MKRKMPRIIDFDSDGDPSSSRSSTKLFGRKRSLHSILGGGKVADVILWKNKSLSATILGTVSGIWFLFEVVEYNFLTLLCHISIITMLAFFIWSKGAAYVDRDPPKIPDIILSESEFGKVALAFHPQLKAFISKLYDVVTGRDLKLFLLGLASLWMLSVVGTTLGSQCSSLSLLFFVYLCIQTLPYLYERYEDEVDDLAGKGKRNLKKAYKEFDSKVLDKIPRGPVKEKKSK